MATKQKNVLMIVVDQWRGDTLKNLGHPVIQTPNIESLASEGVTFAKHYTQAVPCGPGRASMLTGLYMMNHRAVQNTIPLDARHTNIAIEVRKAGYEPALVGYTTTTPDPREIAAEDPRFKVLGADMEGWRPVGSWGLDKEAYFAWLSSQGFPMPKKPNDIWLPQDLTEADIGATAKPSVVPAHLSDTTWFTDRALEYLQGTENKPWFLHLGYYRPHPPFSAAAPYHEMYDPNDCPPPIRAASKDLEASQHPLLDYYLQSIERRRFFENGQGLGADMQDAEVRQMRATYYGLMSEVDHHIGRVFEYLKKTGQWDNTLIVLTSDHGEQLGDHHLLGKIGYFDQSFHIPMIVRDPNPEADATRGNIVRNFTETIDTMPTILNWLERPIPRTCDGHSLLPFVQTGVAPADWRTEVHYEFDFRNIYYSKPEDFLGLSMDQCALSVIQNEQYKYVHFAALPPLFFDLTKDPSQLCNVAQDPSYTLELLKMTQKMLDWKLLHADRTLTGYAATPAGLVSRS
jgi:arylsulfatase A-like enzyme